MPIIKPSVPGRMPALTADLQGAKLGAALDVLGTPEERDAFGNTLHTSAMVSPVLVEPLSNALYAASEYGFERFPGVAEENLGHSRFRAATLAEDIARKRLQNPNKFWNPYELAKYSEWLNQAAAEKTAALRQVELGEKIQGLTGMNNWLRMTRPARMASKAAMAVTRLPGALGVASLAYDLGSGLYHRFKNFNDLRELVSEPDSYDE